MQGARVPSLVWEVRSRVPRSMAKKKWRHHGRSSPRHVKYVLFLNLGFLICEKNSGDSLTWPLHLIVEWINGDNVHSVVEVM